MIWEKLSVNLFKAGELRYEMKYNARDAARAATKWARKGWEATVQTWQTLGTKRYLMECHPASNRRGKRVYAHCSMTPAFKKRIRGL